MSSFSMKRVWYVLRHIAVIQRKNAVITLGAIFGAFTVIILASLPGGVSSNAHLSLAAPYLFIVGIVVTSVSFGELHDGKKSYAYLLLPASSAEKVTAVVIATVLLWVPFALASYELFSLVMALLSLLLTGEAVPPFDPFVPETARVVSVYIVAHAFCLFGAVYFRGKNLVKTVASLAAVGFGIFVVVALVAWLLFQSAGPEIHSLFSNPASSSIAAEALARYAKLITAVVDVLNVLIRYIVPPALWLLTWQRLRETEVAHGV